MAAPLMVPLVWFFKTRTWVLKILMLEILGGESQVIQEFSGACGFKIGEYGYAFILT